jgi:hypothetical protein
MIWFGLVTYLAWFGGQQVWFGLVRGQQCWFGLVKYAGSDERDRIGYYA